jgi:uncharacterized protein YlxW (UPF0749 family)
MSGDQDPTRDAAPVPGEGRARLMAALRRPPSVRHLTAGVLLAILGFAAVVQVQENDKDDKYVGARQGELVQLINNLSLATRRAENQIAELEQTRNSLRNDTQARRTALERARQQADVLGILAGTLPAVGPGVVVTVKDPDHTFGTDQLLNGLQELRDAGAEAIEINNSVRVVAQSWIRDGTSGVVVDGALLSPPYTIEAIGDPDTLSGGLDFQQGFVDEVQKRGGTVVIVPSESVEIASVRQPPAPQYAEPEPAG